MLLRSTMRRVKDILGRISFTTPLPRSFHSSLLHLLPFLLVGYGRTRFW